MRLSLFILKLNWALSWESPSERQARNWNWWILLQPKKFRHVIFFIRHISSRPRGSWSIRYTFNLATQDSHYKKSFCLLLCLLPMQIQLSMWNEKLFRQPYQKKVLLQIRKFALSTMHSNWLRHGLEIFPNKFFFLQTLILLDKNFSYPCCSLSQQMMYRKKVHLVV